MIRFYTPADAAAMLEIYRPYVTQSAVSFEYEPPTLDQFTARLAGFAAVYPVLVCQLDGQIAGYAYAHRLQERKAYDWNAETTIYVDKRFARRGVARALYQALFALLRLQHVHTLYAIITQPNRPSMEFHRAMGFETVYIQQNAGYKMGLWRDVAWMRHVLTPCQGAPEALMPVSALLPGQIAACLQNAAQRQNADG
jgi:L-amino acid N-acyltransferase YncA